MIYQFSIRKTLLSLFNGRFIAIFILMAVTAMLLSGLIGDMNDPDMYVADATVYSAPYSSYMESVIGTYMVREYAGIIDSYRVAERASANMHSVVSPSAIQDMISVSTKRTSVVIIISATSPNRDMAVNVANAAAEALVQEVSTINAMEGIRILDRAEYARLSVRNTIKVARLRVAFILAVLFVLVALRVAFASLDKRVMIVREVTLDLTVPLLGMVPKT